MAGTGAASAGPAVPPRRHGGFGEVHGLKHAAGFPRGRARWVAQRQEVPIHRAARQAQCRRRTCSGRRVHVCNTASLWRLQAGRGTDCADVRTPAATETPPRRGEPSGVVAGCEESARPAKGAGGQLARVPGKRQGSTAGTQATRAEGWGQPTQRRLGRGLVWCSVGARIARFARLSQRRALPFGCRVGATGATGESWARLGRAAEGASDARW